MIIMIASGSILPIIWKTLDLVLEKTQESISINPYMKLTNGKGKIVMNCNKNQGNDWLGSGIQRVNNCSSFFFSFKYNQLHANEIPIKLHFELNKYANQSTRMSKKSNCL